MTKKTIAAENADLLSASDKKTPENATKYICEFPEHMFVMKELDNDGNVVTHTDSKGNNKLPNVKEFHFKKLGATRRPDGSIDPNSAKCYFIATKEELGNDFDRVVKYLEGACENVRNKMFREDAHMKKRNPEAYRIAKEKTELQVELNEKDQKILELEKKLGFKTQNSNQR